ncbi:alpha-amylase family glycosyl hydrolase [Spirilliplanes yamanashiensis]|uniref:Alpha-amylase n=1 Tax=Spirilliplanes yamanashiensis TaxID=42233 RepID=A0A8J3Y375_9ACTN|nr:alpha-amylase family glycosyl hydrolase [Spirilliplanes yamanashiensis]MDP9814247.1 cyclomaltodextrinase [Spirilliplanes yamanashiensis]GIJ00770.1 alpha-amylase [Spirilliplanes yamanashiensis]
MTPTIPGPGWVEHVIWWHAYPLGFVGAERAGGGPVRHRLPQLTAWLDHLLALGANGLALGPVFASETHGYDTVDHYRIDPRLGDDADMDALLAAASAKGVRVLFDGVFNHVGRGHPAFQAVLAEGPGAATASWFRLREWGPGGEPDYDDFEGHHHLVALNHAEPAVVDLVADVMNHWLDRGVDGWRLDAAYAVPSGFWAQVADRVRARHPEAYLMGEVIQGDYAALVADGRLDAVTQYELWKAVWSSLNDRNFHELAHALRRHDGFLDTFVPYTFLGNHDTTRIASRLDDPAHLEHALVVLATVGGTPSVYAGDEHAFRGVKRDREGGDDEVRPPFPATPAELSELGLPTFHRHQELLGLRRRHPWLHAARTEPLEVTNEHLSYASSAGGERLVVALSTGDAPVRLTAPGVSEVLAGDGSVDRPGAADAGVRLPQGGWAVLR